MAQRIQRMFISHVDENTKSVKVHQKKVMAAQLNGRNRPVLGQIGNNACLLKTTKSEDTKATFIFALKKDQVVHKQSDEELSTKKTEDLSRILPVELLPTGQDLSLLNKDVADIDANDYLNPFSCAEYANEIYNYLKKREPLFQVPMNFIKFQPQINERMRAILVDWLVQVHDKFRLVQETLFLTVSILDRYLIVDCKVTKSNFQLVGVTALLLASKIEEIYTPEITDFVYIADNAYSSAMIRDLESKMAAALEYNFGDPLCIHFLRRNSKAAEADVEKHTLAKYFMELMLPDYECIAFPPSQRAAASLCLAMKITDNSTWDATVEHYSHYTEESLESCMKRISQLVVKSANKQSKLNSVTNKYNRAKFFKIASSPCLESPFITVLAEQ